VLDPELLAVLVCPIAKQPLLYVPGVEGHDDCLLSVAARVRYRIEDRVPVLLVEEATAVDDVEFASLLRLAEQAKLP
jgi:uncharacterized protein